MPKTMEQTNHLIILITFLLLFHFSKSSSSNDRKSYIIHMDVSTMPSPFSESHNWYSSKLSSLSSADDDDVPPIHLYTYNHAISGFSAILSQSQLKRVQQMSGHIATYEDTIGHAHTTHSPKFLGLNEKDGLWPTSGFGDDVIIGVIDSGIWPESDSFRDDGMPPIPDRWRGACENGQRFNSSHCNRKLIGARFFNKAMKRNKINITNPSDYDSPRDYWGHGTHVASVAAGSPIPNASFYGYAKGKAMGIAPKARIAIYKVLFYDATYETYGSDVLAAMDQAIADGVDVISLSIGFPKAAFYENPIAIGAFAATEKGIFVACSAGNNGHRSISNGAPWVTTVGAGTTDRDLVARVTFGDGELSINGRSLYPINLFISRVSLYFGRGNKTKETCRYGALDPRDVADKFIFCDFDDESSTTQQIRELERSGAIGAIFIAYFGQTFPPNKFNLPFLFVDYDDVERIMSYLTSSENPIVSIKFQLTVFGAHPYPQVANFSSRGPDPLSPYILKPDILAPGVDILAAWSPESWAAPIGKNLLLTDYMILSGTSMANPHIAGIAALVKATHRNWSPGMIRSALMTTADIEDRLNVTFIDQSNKFYTTPHDFGAGHVNPNKAIGPGLVYDINTQDYINYLCAMNYTAEQIHSITRKSNSSCANASLDLNYPSFVVVLNNNTDKATNYTFKRVLTNVVDSSSTYRLALFIDGVSGANVQPRRLSFDGKYSKAEFNMTLEIEPKDCNSTNGYLSLYEINGTHIVRSPIVCTFAS